MFKSHAACTFRVAFFSANTIATAAQRSIFQDTSLTFRSHKLSFIVIRNISDILSIILSVEKTIAAITKEPSRQCCSPTENMILIFLAAT